MLSSTSTELSEPQTDTPCGLQQQHCGGQRVVSKEKCGNSSLDMAGILPTQDVVSCDLDEADSLGVKPWGRFISYNGSSVAFDLAEKDVYTFGRFDQCDYCFNTNPAIRHTQFFTAYSKIHFKIARENFKDNQFHVFLTDTSSNGTFINGGLIGKNNTSPLKTGDVISLSVKANKVFIFLDPDSVEDQTLPDELRNKYRLSQVLGRGATGEVKLALEKGTNKKYAVKIIEKRKFTIRGKNQMNLSQAVKNEVNILKSLSHPCIIRVEDVIDSDTTIYIVLELVEGGELFDQVVSGAFEEEVAKLLFYQMVVAIKYLHDKNITHRDLKPENVLLESKPPNTLIKITDFGLSKFVDGCEMMRTFCGTPNYLAPEILRTQGSGTYTNMVDCWSLGVILFICLGGYPPFTDDRGDMPLAKQILTASYTFPNKYWGKISRDAIDLIKQLLTLSPEDRLTVAGALDHPWLKDEAMIRKADELMYGKGQDVNMATVMDNDNNGSSTSTSIEESSTRSSSPAQTTETGHAGRILRKRCSKSDEKAGKSKRVAT